MKHDRMIYLCLCRYGRHGLAWAERDAGLTNQRDTIADIRSGQLSDVVQVIELNYVEFTSRDVTEDILKLAGRWDFDPPRLSPSERLEAMRDRVMDYRKHGVV